jgi:UrcA family protein
LVMMHHHKRGLAIVAGAILGGLCAAPSVAATDDNEEVRVARVRTDDLNLAVPAGRRTLDHRIGGAARRVCAWQGRMTDAIHTCMEEAVERARRDSPRVALAIPPSAKERRSAERQEPARTTATF